MSDNHNNNESTAPGRVLLVDDEAAFQRLGGAFLRTGIRF